MAKIINGQNLIGVDETSGDISDYRIMRIPIGTWNMNASAGGSASKLVTHSLGAKFSDVISINVVVFNDAKTVVYDFLSQLTSANASMLNSSRVTLQIRAGGIYDNADFDDTVMNRGYVTLIYKD
jgi:hypothetical protein